jgi:hypothetical protein
MALFKHARRAVRELSALAAGPKRENVPMRGVTP